VRIDFVGRGARHLREVDAAVRIPPDAIELDAGL